MFKDILRPARQSALTNKHEFISDLDAIIATPVYFKLHNKSHEIKPISTKSYLMYVTALSELYALKAKENIDANELIDAYYSLVSSVCDSVTKEDIGMMTQAQIGAMFELIMNTVTGKSQVEAEKKKTMNQ